MKTACQPTFTTYEALLKLEPNDPIRIIFDNIDWSLIHVRYSPHGAGGYEPVSLFKAQLFVYLGEVSSDRKLASALHSPLHSIVKGDLEDLGLRHTPR